MATYYIDPTAAVDGDGLLETTPRNIWPTTLSGHTYLGKRGTRYKQPTTEIAVRNNVVMGSYGAASLEPHEIYADATNSIAVFVYTADNVKISDLKFSGGRTRPFSVGTSVTNLTVEDCTFSGRVDGALISSTGAACWMNGGAGAATMGPVLFLRCTFTDAPFDCVYAVDIGNTTWDQCTLTNPQQSDPGANFIAGGGDCLQISTGVQNTLNNIHVTRCLLENKHGGKHALVVGNTDSTSTQVLIDNCTLIGGRIVLSTWVSNTKVRSCTLTAYNDLYWSHGNLTSRMFNVVGNGSVGLSVKGVKLGGAGICETGFYTESTAAAGDASIENVTFVGITKDYVVWDSNAADIGTISIKNCAYVNTVPASGSILSIGPKWTLTAANNSYAQEQTKMLCFLYMGAGGIYSTLAAVAAAGYGSGTIAGAQSLDPVTYAPLTGSALIGAGAHVAYGIDAGGKAFFNPPSIGAYEAQRARSPVTQARLARG